MVEPFCYMLFKYRNYRDGEAMKSMTGFGSAQRESEKKIYDIQISSVNRRYFDLQIKAPSYVTCLEKSIRDRISSQISRGAITLKLQVQSKGGQEDLFVTTDNAVKVLTHLQSIEKVTAMPLKAESFWSCLLPLSKELGKESPTEIFKEEKAVILDCLDEALKQYDQSRIEEGMAHQQFVVEQLEQVKSQFEIVKRHQGEAFEAKLLKLKDVLSQHLNNPVEDNDSIFKEVVLLADKLDITEELERADQHLRSLSSMLDQNQSKPIAKKLEFILQELNREVNTSSVKSNHSVIQTCCVEIKCYLEKIREVIQNVE